jgi:hypothetical protein
MSSAETRTILVQPAQKVEFLSEDVSTIRDPGVKELRAWFQKNASRFALPSRVTFRHLYFSFDRRGERTRVDATLALAKLAGQPADLPAAVHLADPFMYQSYYADRTPEYVPNVFGLSSPRRWLSSNRPPPGRGPSSPDSVGISSGWIR